MAINLAVFVLDWKAVEYVEGSLRSGGYHYGENPLQKQLCLKTFC